MMIIESSYICLNKVRFHARHGVLAQERLTGGEFTVSLRIKYNFSKATETDDVSDTLNYAAVYEIVKREMQQPSCLIEHVAGRIGRSIFSELPGVEKIDLTLEKINPPMGADASSAAVELHLINNKTF